MLLRRLPGQRVETQALFLEQTNKEETCFDNDLWVKNFINCRVCINHFLLWCLEFSLEYCGLYWGRYEIIVMRLTDVQLTIPSILMALLVNGIAKSVISQSMHSEMAIYVLIFAIGISEWPQFARVSRASTLVEKNKEYVSASRIIGLSNIVIMFKHILPNILRPLLVIATIGLALAIITESTLSFLGVGVPPTTPSLGTLIRFGNSFLFSGEWWITFFPAIFLIVLALSINLLGTG